MSTEKIALVSEGFIALLLLAAVGDRERFCSRLVEPATSCRSPY